MKQIVTTHDVAAAFSSANQTRSFVDMATYSEDVAFFLNKRLRDRARKRREAIGLCFELAGIFILLCGIMVAVSVEDWLGWGCLAVAVGAFIGVAGQRYGDVK
jgi:Flp pilus assembly protein TadB